MHYCHIGLNVFFSTSCRLGTVHPATYFMFSSMVAYPLLCLDASLRSCIVMYFLLLYLVTNFPNQKFVSLTCFVDVSAYVTMSWPT